jgi:hypothetical protein
VYRKVPRVRIPPHPPFQNEEERTSAALCWCPEYLGLRRKPILMIESNLAILVVSSEDGASRTVMKPDYDAILQMALKRDKARWDLGDALVSECGAPDPTSASYAGPGRLRAAWQYLQENGCDYSIEELSKLRRVAYVFGHSTRRFDISWELHAEAGTPETLEAIIGGMPKGTRLTKGYIAFVLKQWKRQRREEVKD